MNKELSKIILASYLLGLLTGILIIIFTFISSFMQYGSGGVVLSVLSEYNISNYVILLSFLTGLWIAAKVAYQNAKGGRSSIGISLRYSAIINGIVFIIFALISLLTVERQNYSIFSVLLQAFLICTIFSTFTLGFLFAYIVRRIIRKSSDLNSIS